MPVLEPAMIPCITVGFYENTDSDRLGKQLPLLQELSFYIFKSEPLPQALDKKIKKIVLPGFRTEGARKRD